MGMYDEYEPNPPIACALCARILSGWQGKDGPCSLLRWTQGVADPSVAHFPEDRRSFEGTRLPRVFGIYTTCPCGRWVEATGFSDEGCWTRTELAPSLASAREQAFPDEPGRRRCGRCKNVWVVPESTVMAECPACGVMGRLG
ncbi:MAG TPA: hypothetical protein VGI39_45060 [Polyangiaceae bacterium]